MIHTHSESNSTIEVLGWFQFTNRKRYSAARRSHLAYSLGGSNGNGEALLVTHGSLQIENGPMPLFISAKIGQKRIIFAKSTKCSMLCEHASSSRVCPAPRLKIRKIEPTSKERKAKRNRHDKMPPRSTPGTPDGSLDDMHINAKHDESLKVKLLKSFCPIRDSLQTETSIVQDETMEACLPLLASFEQSQQDSPGRNTVGIPRLEREKHVGFLHQCWKPLAAGFVGFDASRPWILYWVLAGLSLLGENVQPYKER